MRQIIKNLLSNALKFVHKGKVRLRLENQQDNICLTVKDDGIGIEQDKLEHIFDRFKQANDSTSREFGGSGLGLSICNELAHLLGGEIVVNSQVNKGTTFILTLPKHFKKENVISYTNTINIKDSKFSFPITKNPLIKTSGIKNILVVSDEYLSLFTTFVSLKKEGIQVEQLNSQEEAFIQLDNTSYDVLLIKLDSCTKELFSLLNRAKELKMKTVIITSDPETIPKADLIIKIADIESLLINELLKL
ncbi:MAG: hypothetical protein HRT43_04730 [Campylobacteraceae bacterium]|nr:hypothetical protein [Campylobacteraceae bacterium]